MRAYFPMDRRAACCLLAILAVASPASAQPGASPSGEEAPLVPAPPAPLAKSPSRPYGYQLLGADLLALGIGIAVAQSQEADDGNHRLGQIASTTWSIGLLSSMAIHGVHHRPRVGFGASATRLMMPPLATVLGMGGVCLFQQKRTCAADGAAWGFAAGVAAAIAADAMYFSRLDSQLETRNFYGTPTLIIDALGFGLGGLFLASNDTTASGVPYTTNDKALIMASLHYAVSVLGAPWVHVRHWHLDRALGSLGIRLVTPGVGAVAGLIGYCAATGATDDCTKTGAAFGFLGGTALAAAIDVAWLTWDERQARSSGGPRLAPYAAPAEGGLTFGIVGSN